MLQIWVMCEKWQIRVQSFCTVQGLLVRLLPFTRNFACTTKPFYKIDSIWFPKEICFINVDKGRLLQNIKHNIHDFFPFPALVPTGKLKWKSCFKDRCSKEKNWSGVSWRVGIVVQANNIFPYSELSPLYAVWKPGLWHPENWYSDFCNHFLCLFSFWDKK